MDAVKTGYPYELSAEDPFKMPPPVIPECPVCSGKVSRDDPAAQALAWGVRVAESVEGASGYWRTLLATEFYGMAQRQSAPVDELVSCGLRGASALSHKTRPLYEGSDLLFSESAADSEEEEGDGLGLLEGQKIPHYEDKDPETPPPDTDKVPWPPRSAGGSGADEGGSPSPEDKGNWFGKGTCCPIAPFHFPVPGTVAAIDGSGQGDAKSPTATPSFQYEVESNYEEVSSHCLCECCVFRQEVLENHLSAKTGEVGTTSERSTSNLPTGAPPSGLDCFWLFDLTTKDSTGRERRGKHPYLGGQEAPPPRPTHTRLGRVIAYHGTEGPFCVGGDAPLPGRSGGTDEDPRGVTTGQGNCKFSWADTPQVAPARYGEADDGTHHAWSFTWTWRVKGWILDRCHLYEERASKEWEVVWGGTVTANNRVSMRIVSESSSESHGRR